MHTKAGLRKESMASMELHNKGKNPFLPMAENVTSDRKTADKKRPVSKSGDSQSPSKGKAVEDFEFRDPPSSPTAFSPNSGSEEISPKTAGGTEAKKELPQLSYDKPTEEKPKHMKSTNPFLPNAPPLQGNLSSTEMEIAGSPSKEQKSEKYRRSRSRTRYLEHDIYDSEKKHEHNHPSDDRYVREKQKVIRHRRRNPYAMEAQKSKGIPKKKPYIPVILRGTLFGGLKEIPRNRSLDPPLFSCFNCWQEGHRSKRCPKPTSVYCANCGRRGIKVQNCPRCGEVYRALNEKEGRSLKKEYPIDGEKLETLLPLETEERQHLRSPKPSQSQSHSGNEVQPPAAEPKQAAAPLKAGQQRLLLHSIKHLPTLLRSRLMMVWSGLEKGVSVEQRQELIQTWRELEDLPVEVQCALLESSLTEMTETSDKPDIPALPQKE